MRRRFLIAILSLGVVGGYGSGLVHMRHQHMRWQAMHHSCGGGSAHEDGQRGTPAQ